MSEKRVLAIHVVARGARLGVSRRPGTTTFRDMRGTECSSAGRGNVRPLASSATRSATVVTLTVRVPSESGVLSSAGAGWGIVNKP